MLRFYTFRKLHIQVFHVLRVGLYEALAGGDVVTDEDGRRSRLFALVN